MPYILVNLVLETLSLIWFCATGAALLSKYSWTNRYLPEKVRAHRGLAFTAQGLVLLVLSVTVVYVVASGRAVFIAAQGVFELFFYVALANSVVLTYQLLDRRWLRHTPKYPRRFLIAICALIMPSAAAIAVTAVMIRLFLIR